MSEVILEIVEEFFQQRRYFTARHGNLVLIKKNKKQSEPASDNGFIIDETTVENISAGIVKSVGWHTCKITTRILETFPEIIEFARDDQVKKFADWFNKEPLKKLLVIPQLPSHAELRENVIKKLQDTGIDHLITIPTIIYGVIEKIQPRKVYSSPICDLLHMLKFYNIISSTKQQMELPL